MRSVRVHYNDGKVLEADEFKVENWVDVCDKFDGDVHRKMDFEKNNYTALYECFDDNNKPVYYLVEEDESLNSIRRKNFKKNLGLDKI